MSIMRNLSPKMAGGQKTFARNLLVALAADVLLSAIILFFLRHSAGDQPIELLLVVERWILLGFFVVNICLAVATMYVKRKLYPILMINSILSGGVFHLLFIIALL